MKIREENLKVIEFAAECLNNSQAELQKLKVTVDDGESYNYEALSRDIVKKLEKAINSLKLIENK